MKIIIKPNYEEMSKKCAAIFLQEIQKKKNIVLGMPAGNTPLGVYEKLVKTYKKGKIDFSKVITFNLDEYIGLPKKDKRSFTCYMFNNFFNYINIKKSNIHIPDGNAKDFKRHCIEYEKQIKKSMGIDLMLLGIGPNGHIGFNEPGSSFNSRTRVVELSDEIIKRDKKVFNGKVPKFVITMGVRTIMESRKIILIASGRKKAQIIKRAIEGHITSEVPASFLRLHPDVTYILDKEAGSKL